MGVVVGGGVSKGVAGSMALVCKVWLSVCFGMGCESTGQLQKITSPCGPTPPCSRSPAAYAALKSLPLAAEEGVAAQLEQQLQLAGALLDELRAEEVHASFALCMWCAYRHCSTWRIFVASVELFTVVARSHWQQWLQQSHSRTRLHPLLQAAWPTTLTEDAAQLAQRSRGDVRAAAALRYRMQRKVLVKTGARLLAAFIAGSEG
jgi:hypothetical protein